MTRSLQIYTGTPAMKLSLVFNMTAENKMKKEAEVVIRWQGQSVSFHSHIHTFLHAVLVSDTAVLLSINYQTHGSKRLHY